MRTSGGSSVFSRATSASSSARRSAAAADAALSPSPSPSPPPPASARGGPRTVTVAACRMACTPLSVRPAATGPPSWPVASLSAACTTSKIDGGPGTPGCACHPHDASARGVGGPRAMRPNLGAGGRQRSAPGELPGAALDGPARAHRAGRGERTWGRARRARRASPPRLIGGAHPPRRPRSCGLSASN
eukprot:scaffold41065_cov80-Phaeocystis_antarctica.AAC.4